jgi:hypothetical protein
MGLRIPAEGDACVSIHLDKFAPAFVPASKGVLDKFRGVALTRCRPTRT